MNIKLRHLGYKNGKSLFLNRNICQIQLIDNQICDQTRFQ